MKNSGERVFNSVVAVSCLLLISWLGGFFNVENAAKFGVRMGDGTFFHFQSDEYHKMEEVSTAVHGNYFIGNPFTYEEKLAPPPYSPYGMNALATVLRLCRIDVATSSYLLDFIMPVVALLLTFVMFARLFPTVDRTELFSVSFLFVLLFMMAPNQRSLMRYMHAQVTIPFALYLMTAIFLMAQNRLGRLEYAFVALLSGCFVFADVWYPLLIVGFLLVVMTEKILRGDFTAAGRSGFLILATGIIGSYEILRIASLSRLPGFKLLEERAGAFSTFVPSYPIYIPYVGGLLLITAILNRINFFRTSRDIIKICMMSLLFCTAIYFQNLVTYKRLYFQGEHVAGMVLLPAGMIVVVILLNLLIRIKSRAARGAILMAMTLGASIYHVHMTHAITAMNTPADAFDPIYGYNALWIQKHYRPAFDWLKENGETDAVVLTDPSLAPEAILSASPYAYCALTAVHASLDQEALMERYYPFLTMKSQLRTATPIDPVWHINEKIRDYDPRDYGIVFQSAGTVLPHKLRINAFFKKWGLTEPFDVTNDVRKFQSHIDDLYGGFERFMSGRNAVGIRDSLKYRCDYVLWGPQERRFYPRYEPNSDPTLKLTFLDQANNVAVYEVL